VPPIARRRSPLDPNRNRCLRDRYYMEILRGILSSAMEYTPFGNLRSWKTRDHVFWGNTNNGFTAFRVSVMGVPVGKVTCDSSVSHYEHAILGGAHVDIASKTLPPCAIGGPIFI
jgi:hypothetical protein